MCKGSTTDSDSVCEGSNPSSAAIARVSGLIFRGVAQLGRALRSGRRGRWFESSHLDQLRASTRNSRIGAFLLFFAWMLAPQPASTAFPVDYASGFVFSPAFGGGKHIIFRKLKWNCCKLSKRHKNRAGRKGRPDFSPYAAGKQNRPAHPRRTETAGNFPKPQKRVRGTRPGTAMPESSHLDPMESAWILDFPVFKRDFLLSE